MADLYTRNNVLYNVDYAYNFNQDYSFLYNLNSLGHEKKLTQNSSIIVKTNLDKHFNDYSLNNFGFRDYADLIKNNPADIVALGCSNTFGLGLNQNYIWPSILQNNTGLKVANLGIAGSSVHLQLSSFLYYLNNIGLPKYVFALLPDCFRFSCIDDNFSYTSGHSDDSSILPKKLVTSVLTVNFITGESENFDKIIKTPTRPEYFISGHQALEQYINAIYTIQSICKLLNIKFYYSTWHNFSENTLLNIMFKNSNSGLNKNNYVSINENFADCEDYHGNIKDEIINKMWFTAADNKHLGIHWHTHAAEHFIEKIKDDNTWNK
jgi:hypothetical protein